jgi:osmoprotectant transport system ATP-binding protein
MINFEAVSKNFGGANVVDALSFTIEAGEFAVLIGPSGSGKSTTLKMINRLIDRNAGVIRFDGQDVQQVAAEQLRRRMGYVIQSGGLFPHWTVERNIAAVPSLLRWPRARIAERVEALLHLLRLDKEGCRGRYPHQLSGGQQQRVGVARALAAEPDVVLMDEPFGALDPITRETLQVEIARIHAETGKTIVFVTHDMQEALKLASRIVILDHGRVVQVGTPMELLTMPANDFVREFVGQDDPGGRLLAFETVAQRLRPGEAAPGSLIADTATLRQALSAMIVRHQDRIGVADVAGQPIGTLYLADIVRR